MRQAGSQAPGEGASNMKRIKRIQRDSWGVFKEIAGWFIVFFPIICVLLLASSI